MKFKKGLDFIPVHRTEPTQEKAGEKIAGILGLEFFPDPVTGETLYRPKNDGRGKPGI
jgi:hypothetical protein